MKKYVAAHAIEIGSPALHDKSTGEEKRPSTLKSIAAGEDIPSDLAQEDLDRLLELNAIVETSDPKMAKAVAKAEAEEQARQDALKKESVEEQARALKAVQVVEPDANKLTAKPLIAKAI